MTMMQRPMPRPRTSKARRMTAMTVENPEYMYLDVFRSMSSSSPTMSNESLSVQSRSMDSFAPTMSNESLSVQSRSMDSFDLGQLELTDCSRSLIELDFAPWVGQSICFSAWIRPIVNGKALKRCWAMLQGARLVFYPSDDELDRPLFGPLAVCNLVFVGEGQSSSSVDLVVAETNSDMFTHIQFESEAPREHWLLLLAKSTAPLCEILSEFDSAQMAGRVRLKQGATGNWNPGWAMIIGHELHYVMSATSNDTLFVIDIRKVFSIVRSVNKADWCPTFASQNGPFLLSYDGSSLYIQSESEFATSLWADFLSLQITRLVDRLEDYRLTPDDIPVLVDKCIKFIATYGLYHEGIYRKNGSLVEVRQLLDDLRRDPASVHLIYASDESVNVVADVLRRFFRQLQEPLICSSIQTALLNICGSTITMEEKVPLYQDVLLKMPKVHLQTLRKLLDHLKDITENCSRNRATIDNIAKVFGPTLFSVENDEETGGSYAETAARIAVVRDLISNYAVIFKRRPEELSAKSQMENLRWINDRIHETGLVPKARAGGLLVPIHCFERDNQAFNVQIDWTAEQVCEFARTHRLVDGESGQFALFEVVKDGQLERRVASNEQLRSMVVARWLDWTPIDCFLLFKRDTNPFNCEQSYPFTNDAKLADVGSKSFKKCFLQIQSGITVCQFRDEKCNRILREWPADRLLWFWGHETKRDPPHPYTLTFVVDGDEKSYGKRSKFLGFCLAFKEALHRTQWMNAVLGAHGGYSQQSQRLIPV